MSSTLSRHEIKTGLIRFINFKSGNWLDENPWMVKSSCGVALGGEQPNYRRCTRASSSPIELRHLKHAGSPNRTKKKKKKVATLKSTCGFCDSDRAAVLMSALSVVSYPVLPTRPLCVLEHGGGDVARATSGFGRIFFLFYFFWTQIWIKGFATFCMKASLSFITWDISFARLSSRSVFLFRWLSPFCQFTYCCKFLFFFFLPNL